MTWRMLIQHSYTRYVTCKLLQLYMIRFGDFALGIGIEGQVNQNGKSLPHSLDHELWQMLTALTGEVRKRLQIHP